MRLVLNEEEAHDVMAAIAIMKVIAVSVIVNKMQHTIMTIMNNCVVYYKQLNHE